MSLFMMFTGQGSQFVGMGKTFAHFPEMHSAMEEMDSALGRSLSKDMMSGDDYSLTLTENAQPAIACVSVGIWNILRSRFNIEPIFMAGHSAGEFSALCAAGTISWHDTTTILNIRGKAMQNACPAGYGGMAAVLGMDFDSISAILSTSQLPCYVANDNGGGQVVISGEKNALSRASELLKKQGASRIIELNVSAPFHTPLIMEAEMELRSKLDNIDMVIPKYNVLSNVTALPYEKSVESIKTLLVSQVTHPVRWREIVEYVADAGVEYCAELGPAPVLSKLTPRISKNMKAISVCNEGDLNKFEEFIAISQSQ